MMRWLGELSYPLADASGRVMRLRAAGFDSGGAAGVTQQAYDAWRRAFQRRQARLLGMTDGREAWNLIPTKGLGSVNAVRLQVRRPDSARNDRTARAAGAIPLAQFSANAFKDDLAGQLARAEAGPGFVHFPAALLDPQPPHAFFEQLTAEARRANGTWEKLAVRNEALDLMVGAHVVAHLHGLARIDWSHPPPWAREWDANAAVRPDTAQGEGKGARSPSLSAPGTEAPAKPGWLRDLVKRLP